MTRNDILAPDCAVRDGRRCDLVSIGEFPDASGKVGRIEVLRCSYCGHGITTPPLRDVSFLYEGRESQDYQPDTRGFAAAIKNIAFRLQARRLLRQVPATPRSILDFGCGSGQFTRILSDVLQDTLVVGSDFHPDPPPALGAVAYRPMHELTDDANQYDLVLAMHVLEHDDDTRLLLSRLAALVAPGGMVVIEVPNVDCVWTGIFGKKWDAWYVPYHRTHFTRASLKHHIEASGLELLRMHDAAVPTMGRTMANIFGCRNNLFWLLVGIVLHPIQWLGERLSREASAIRVIARV